MLGLEKDSGYRGLSLYVELDVSQCEINRWLSRMSFRQALMEHKQLMVRCSVTQAAVPTLLKKRKIK